jgi:hypothetical protein
MNGVARVLNNPGFDRSFFAHEQYLKKGKILQVRAQAGT